MLVGYIQWLFKWKTTSTAIHANKSSLFHTVFRYINLRHFGFFSAVIFTSLPQVPELESLYNNFMRQMSVLSGRYLVV